VTEYVACTLKDAVGRGGKIHRSTTQASVGLDLANALVEIHRAGIVHLNIYPESVFIKYEGNNPQGHPTALIGGFTYATFAKSAITPRDYSNHPIASYVAPELLGRKANVAMYEQDVFQYGTTLAFLMTGSPPADTNDVDALVSRYQSGTHLLANVMVNSSLNSVLQQLIQNCAAIAPGQRLTADQILALLASYEGSTDNLLDF
jgi:serine/threonine protein kinase